MRTGFVLVLAALAVARADRAIGQTSATIYTDSRVMIRQTISARIPAGTTSLRVKVIDPDPATFVALDPGVNVLRVSYPAAENEAAVIRRALGRWILFARAGADTVTGRIISIDPVRVEVRSGGVVAGLPGTPIFPIELIPSSDSLEIVVESSRPLERLRFAYQTFGATWSARYVVRLGERSSISGFAAITSDLVALDSTEVDLFAGLPMRLPDLAERRLQARARDEMVAVRGLSSAEAASTTLGGHRLYSLPGRHALIPGTRSLLPLFRPLAAPIERVHLVDATISLGQLGPSHLEESAVLIRYRAERAPGTDFGDRSLPAGEVAVYDGSPGRETLIGQAILPHTPARRPFEVDAGRATEVKAFRTNGEYRIVQDSVVNPNGSVSIRASAQVQTFEWRLTNATDTPVVVELVDRRPQRSRILESTTPAEAVDGGTRFRATVPGKGESRLSYRIRVEQ